MLYAVQINLIGYVLFSITFEDVFKTTCIVKYK